MHQEAQVISDPLEKQCKYDEIRSMDDKLYMLHETIVALKIIIKYLWLIPIYGSIIILQIYNGSS